MSARASGAPPLPAGWRLRPAPSLRVMRGGRVLLGGAPLRVLTLSATGASVIETWLAGEPVGDRPPERRLARRLLDAGLVHPDPPAAATPDQLTVVVPVRDRPEELRRCLASIDSRCRTVVVDDGSRNAEAIAEVAASAGADRLRFAVSRGPSAARNAGLRSVQTPFVAFVDSDCVVAAGFPGRLLDHLRDPVLAAVAPRIVALDVAPVGLLARYEAHHASLDMGLSEGLVQAGTAIPYAPSAALVARVSALGPGFAEELAMGEDVDLLWRLHDQGWQVRYDPAVTVAHAHRTRPRAWFGRRVAYNMSNAVLLARHPGRVPALSLTRGGAAFWAAAAAGSPVGASAVATLGATMLHRELRHRVPGSCPIAVRLMLQARLHEGRHLARALAGPWLPGLLAITALRRPLARRLWLGIGIGLVAEWSAERYEPTPVHYAVPRLAEDAARCVGVWRGCWQERSLGALLPQLRRR